jgi:hypothetical protein
MDIACWNCKTVTKLDKVAVEAAIAQMDTAKLGFHDVVCSSCGKANRTARDLFDAALKAFAVAVPQTTKKTKEEDTGRQPTKGEFTKIVEDEKARRRGGDASKGPKKGKK